jgi:hypothetical protein
LFFRHFPWNQLSFGFFTKVVKMFWVFHQVSSWKIDGKQTTFFTEDSVENFEFSNQCSSDQLFSKICKEVWLLYGCLSERPRWYPGGMDWQAVSRTSWFAKKHHGIVW